jgi:hypothetical protein
LQCPLKKKPACLLAFTDQGSSSSENKASITIMELLEQAGYAKQFLWLIHMFHLRVSQLFIKKD